MGGYEFVEAFTRRAAEQGVSVMRHRHGNDGVTRIPVDVIYGVDFGHVGTPIHILDGVLAPESDPLYELEGAFADHGMMNYYLEIRQAWRDARDQGALTCPR